MSTLPDITEPDGKTHVSTQDPLVPEAVRTICGMRFVPTTHEPDFADSPPCEECFTTMLAALRHMSRVIHDSATYVDSEQWS